MVKETHNLVWTIRSQQQLKKLFEFIKKKSPQNAQKVILEIIAAAQILKSNPEYYNPDKFRPTNDGTFRAYEKYSYRIAYRFNKKTVRIIRVRHTKMEPKQY